MPDMVFVGAINKVCRSDVTPPELNNSLKTDIEKGHEGFKKVLQVHRAKSRMCDPTTPNDTKRRWICFYYVCRPGEKRESVLRSDSDWNPCDVLTSNPLFVLKIIIYFNILIYLTYICICCLLCGSEGTMSSEQLYVSLTYLFI